MTIYFMYLLTLVVTLLFFIIIKDKIKALRLTGILTITSSILLISLTFIAKFILNVLIQGINLSTIINHIFMKFVYTSLILFLLGLTEIIISKYIYSKKKATV